MNFNNSDEVEGFHQSKAVVYDSSRTVWGQLYPHSGTFPRLTLKQEMFRLGRDKTSESDIGGSKWLNAVSKCQCEFVMNNIGVFLWDNSSNGIWGNGNKVARTIYGPSTPTQRSASLPS